MLSFDDYVRGDATTWAERIAQKDVKPLEVVDAAIARAEAVNPKINAIAVSLFEQARERAKHPASGALAGVPWAIKDLYQTVEGVPLTNGSRAFAGQVSKSDSELVRRFKAAGLNILCTSTSPELGLAATTESTLYGATANPWDLTRIAGGSSGGAAALVAAGVLPAAHATDGGGSIRGPAFCCGLFGLKPSRGRVPMAPGRTEGWLGCSTSHAVSRSVRDSALLMDLTHGPEAGSRYVAPPPRRTFLEAVSRPPPKLRIAVHWQARAGVVVDPECIKAAEDAAKLCESLGHIVEQAAPPVDLDDAARAFGAAVLASIASTVQARAAELGRNDLENLFEQTTREYAAYGEAITAIALVRANDAFMRAAFAVAKFQETYDVILSPTMGKPPLKLGEACLMQPSAGFDAAHLSYSPFTALQNMTGQPAMNVPLYWTESGLPVGVQFAGRVGEEELLFSLAAQLEQARPWFDKRPPL